MLTADLILPSGWTMNKWLLGVVIGTASPCSFRKAARTSRAVRVSISLPKFLVSCAASFPLSFESAKRIITGFPAPKSEADLHSITSSSPYTDAICTRTSKKKLESMRGRKSERNEKKDSQRQRNRRNTERDRVD